MRPCVRAKSRHSRRVSWVCTGCLLERTSMSELHHRVRPGRQQRVATGLPDSSDFLQHAAVGLPPRRLVLRGLANLGLTASFSTLPGRAAAKKHKRRRRKKVTRNAFGCVNVEGRCRNSAQCCSGICSGKRGKKTCAAHNASTCQGTDGCGGESRSCMTDGGVYGNCNVTTGQASYCVVDALCADCATDIDCEPICGVGAACLVCSECISQGRQTACASANADGCLLA
jgi:hypothetical protein